jgi:hypothetical protein
MRSPTAPVAVASWLPLKPALTVHGLRHGHQTWLDDLGVRYVLQSERMGHEVPGMRGVYSHVTQGMRDELTAGLQSLWESSLAERARLASRSAVPMLDDLLLAVTEPRPDPLAATAPALQPGKRVGARPRLPTSPPNRSAPPRPRSRSTPNSLPNSDIRKREARPSKTGRARLPAETLGVDDGT